MSAVPKEVQAFPQRAPDEAPQEQRERVTVADLQQEKPLTKDDILRPSIGAALTTLGCAFLVGGMFSGFAARFFTSAGGLAGVALAVWAASARKRQALIQGLSVAGIFFVGLAAVLIRDPGGLGSMFKDMSEAYGFARLNRPPVAFLQGWTAIVVWTMALIGFTSAWIGSIGRKPAVGLLVPIPVLAFAAVAQPDEAQVVSGIIGFATFVIGLAVIYRADRGEGDGVSTAYELKRAMRTAPIVVALVVALFLLAQTNFLFPEPRYDPTQKAQLPQAVRLSDVEDRILFETRGEFTGPWRTGVLTVYDGENWRLPAFADSEFEDVPLTGRLGDAFGTEYAPQIQSDVSVLGLQGVVLPLPGRMHGIRVEEAPPLVTDPLSETIRLDEGQVKEGLNYTVQFENFPSADRLKTAPSVRDQQFLADYTDTAGVQPPPAVVELLQKAPTTSLWDKLDFLRQELFDTVTATGGGVPVPVSADRVDDMLAGSREASPFEIVAAQALLARWAGVPARIGYGFDRGKDSGDVIEFRPVHGSAWLEVYFEDNGWSPITGLPKKAKASNQLDEQQLDVEILPSEEISIQLFIPLRTAPPSKLFKQIQKVALVVLPVALVLGTIWVMWPMVYKSRRRTKRHAWALTQGRTARIAVAYADFRDLATDLGVGDPYATPLAYVDKVVHDEEHLELAWLVSRCLWGDLRDRVTDDEVYAAEELSRSLRRRIFEAQPFTIRGIAFVSRLSLHNPYAPELLSPPLQPVTPGRLVRGTLGLVGIGKKGPESKEIGDEAVGSV
ncbi:MAG TPA: transglutaminaseTgpA domain-containing protein [Actinomycetota bacterium]